jgi:hypothetical protein
MICVGKLPSGVTVERVIGDGAYGSGDNRAAWVNYPAHSIDLVSPLSQPHDPEVDKSAFQIDLETRRATCPQGHTVTGKDRKDRQGGSVFQRSPRRTAVRGKPGREARQCAPPPRLGLLSTA